MFPRCCPKRVVAVLAILFLSALPAFGQSPTSPEDLLDKSKNTEAILLHERWWAWEPVSDAMRPTEVHGPVDWIKLQVSGARSQAADWLEDGGFSLLKDKDPYGSKRFTFATGALTTKWASFHFRARIGRPEMSAGLRPKRHSPAFGVTVPWNRFVLEIEALDDGEFGYSLLTGLRWTPGADRRVQYGVAVPVSLDGSPSAAAILQVLIRLDDLK
jgi:hypothetical protein